MIHDNEKQENEVGHLHPFHFLRVFQEINRILRINNGGINMEV